MAKIQNTDGQGTNIYLYEDDRAMLMQVGKDYGLNGLSAAVRFIIRDWQKYKSREGQRATNVADNGADA